MNKSEFYKQWLTRLPGVDLNEYGYPPVLWKGFPITTEQEWQDFLLLENEVEDFHKISKDAAEFSGKTYVAPHSVVRVYPDHTDQLDGIYKALLALKNAGQDLGPAGNAYIDSISAVKTQFPKTHDVPPAPDSTQFSDTEKDVSQN